jgi:pimeloyl-ACP methyl ester carboxylesterase
MQIDTNGIKVQAYDSGAPGTALVFLHYWGGTARSWAPVIAQLPEALRKITIDARGWGGSDRPESGYDMATMADDVEAVIAHLGVDRYILVGHSMGGKVAQLLASRCPAGLAGLVLVAPSPAQGKALSAQEREALSGAYTSSEAIGWTIDHVLTERVLPAFLREQVMADSLSGADEAKRQWPAAGIAEDVSANVGSIAVPVIVIGGEKDKVDSVEMLASMVVPSLPGATMRTIAGVGHLIPLEAPEELARCVVEFIQEI